MSIQVRLGGYYLPENVLRSLLVSSRYSQGISHKISLNFSHSSYELNALLIAFKTGISSNC